MTVGMPVAPGSAGHATEAFRAARDQLLDWRGDQQAAVEGFRWPDVGDRFNWAIDWFDAIARGNEQPALVILEEADAAAGKTAQSWSFDTLARRSDQVAA
jgi:acetyl-CoA synthetase